jgi:uncharacterized caspase-like protein
MSTRDVALLAAILTNCRVVMSKHMRPAGAPVMSSIARTERQACAAKAFKAVFRRCCFRVRGMTGLDGKNYLLPVNGIEYIEDLEDDALSLEKVNKQLEGSGCFMHVVVADACRSLPTLRSRSRAATQPRGMSVCSAASAEVGSLLAYSCDLGKTAADGEGRNGAFTTALLRHLTTPGLHVENVFTRAARDCQELTKHQREPQKPWKAANLTHEHVCLF